MARLTPEQRQRAGEAVQMRRAELGLTQVELTERAHVTGDRVGVIERAQEWPQPRTRAAIEKALGWRAGALADIARGADPGDMLIEQVRADGPGNGRARADADAIWAMVDALMGHVPPEQRAQWAADVTADLVVRIGDATGTRADGPVGDEDLLSGEEILRLAAPPDTPRASSAESA